MSTSGWARSFSSSHDKHRQTAGGSAGPKGETGAPGSKGEKGTTGEAGTAGTPGQLEVRTFDGTTAVNTIAFTLLVP